MKSPVRAALLSLLLSKSAYSNDLKIVGASKETFAKSVAATADKEVSQKSGLNLIATGDPPAGAKACSLLSVTPQGLSSPSSRSMVKDGDNEIERCGADDCVASAKAELRKT